MSSLGKRKRANQMVLLEEMRNMLQKQNEKLESMFQENQYLREKVSCLTADISRLDGYLQQSPAPRMLSDQQCRTPLRLKFMNSCKNDKYSKHKIEADDKTPLMVAICNHKNEVITSEPFSSMRVQVVPIQGDFDNDQKGQWTEKHFCSKIVSGRPGKEHLLSGDLYIRLQNGVGYLNSAKFQDNSSFVASKRFKLGVMAADDRISERIQEGISDSFAVKDVRGYSTKKNLNPSPCDPVYKLRKIAKDGDRHKLLEQNGIRTVGDFVLSYNQSHEDLRKILGKISDQDWDLVINHAKKCNPRPTNHELATMCRTDGSWYLKGSSSMQPSPAPQKLGDVQLMHQQSSSTYNELSFGVSLEDTPREEEQVSGVGNEGLSASLPYSSTLEGSSSQQGRSSDYKTMLYGDAQTHVNSDTNFWDWTSSIGDPGWEGSCSPFEQSGGRTPASEAGSCGSFMGYSHSPATTRCHRLSSSPAQGASSSSYWACPAPPLGGADLAAPQICPDNISNAGTDFTNEFIDSLFLDPIDWAGLTCDPAVPAHSTLAIASTLLLPPPSAPVTLRRHPPPPPPLISPPSSPPPPPPPSAPAALRRRPPPPPPPPSAPAALRRRPPPPPPLISPPPSPPPPLPLTTVPLPPPPTSTPPHLRLLAPTAVTPPPLRHPPPSLPPGLRLPPTPF